MVNWKLWVEREIIISKTTTSHWPTVEQNFLVALKQKRSSSPSQLKGKNLFVSPLHHISLNTITASACSDYFTSFLCKTWSKKWKHKSHLSYILCLFSLWPTFDSMNKILPSCKYLILNKIDKDLKIIWEMLNLLKIFLGSGICYALLQIILWIINNNCQ